MTYTFDSDIVSDLHKDVYGSRPSNQFWANWTNGDNDHRQATWDSLLVSLKRVVAEEEQRRQEDIARFEALVTHTIDSGARDRATALRWIMDASDCNGDWEYLCYQHGLPYTYFQKAA